MGQNSCLISLNNAQGDFTMKNPGWVDLQVNGHNGVDYSDPNLTADGFLRSAEQLIASGTEVFFPTIITSPLELFRRNGRIIYDAVEKHGLLKNVPGLHYEGPFIARAAIGSHNPDWVQIPTIEAVDALLDTAPGYVKIVTISADAEGAPEAIKHMSQKGVTVSVGHHMATYEQVRAAADAGAKLLTHLGNGCPNMIDRHRNPIYAGLAEDRLTAMLISDGHHLPGELLKVMIQCKGVDNVIITSDACNAAGFPPGEYDVLGNHAILTPEGKLYNPEKNCLVASASTISMCMNFLEKLNLYTEDELLRMGRTNAMNMLHLQ